LKTLHPRKHKVDERDQEEQDPNGENLGIADITGRINKISEREGDPMDRFASLAPDPEQQASNSEVGRLLEEAVEKLPVPLALLMTSRLKFPATAAGTLLGSVVTPKLTI
jgi:hypothetical protein